MGQRKGYGMTDIIIVSYKDKEDLERCISSVEKYCTDYNLIIEDNNIHNRGFTKAVNDGIQKTTSEFIWLLNSDAIVVNYDTLPELLSMFSYHARVGLVSSMQIDYEDKDRIRYGGSNVCFPAGIHLSGRISMGHHNIPSKQKWVNFASVALRRKMVNEIGLLDPTMYLVYSDSSYCYTARKHGWECWYTPYSKVCHGLKASKGLSEWHQKDMRAFMDKWGITYNEKTNSFQYSALFQKLDMFP
jgi:GT2 family glycosyltransferase